MPSNYERGGGFPSEDVESDMPVDWSELELLAQTGIDQYDNPETYEYDDAMAHAFRLLLVELRNLAPTVRPGSIITPAGASYQMIQTLDASLKKCLKAANGSEKALKIGVRELAKNLKDGIIM